MSDGPIDVRCLPYMPLQIEQLRKSKTWLRCRRRPEMAFYLMNLWMRAWHEVPAGSIEDDDDVLADAALCSPDRWDEVRETVLEGWEQHDGRLWHRTVTDLATEAASKLRKNQRRTEAAREALEKQRAASVTEPVTDAVTGTVTDLATEAATETVTDIVTEPEGKGREGKRKKKEGGAVAQADYAFEGEVIRLKDGALQRWRKAYSGIPDIAAELTKADDYYRQNPPKDGDWFYPVSRWLAKAHEDALKKRTPTLPNGKPIRDDNGDLTNAALFGRG